jgi:hypothetical protein
VQKQPRPDHEFNLSILQDVRSSTEQEGLLSFTGTRIVGFETKKEDGATRWATPTATTTTSKSILQVRTGQSLEEPGKSTRSPVGPWSQGVSSGSTSNHVSFE